LNDPRIVPDRRGASLLAYGSGRTASASQSAMIAVIIELK
jgi:hypothetical protein